MFGSVAAADPIRLFAAGSLKAAMGDIADAFEADRDALIMREFGPSGLMRQRIENGDAADIFASANMIHPRSLSEAGLAGSVVLFARNRLCALTQPDLGVTPATLLEAMLRDDIRLGTSTPKADPSGDYAWKVFAKAEALEAGAQSTLADKALKLTGGADSPAAPAGRNTYGWVMEEDRADIFLTYCTNAVLAQREVPALEIVTLPEPLGVGADYGLTLLGSADAVAAEFALFVLSDTGQEILSGYGFEAPTLIGD